VPLPLGVLLLVMAATSWLAIDRHNDISIAQDRFDEAATQGFAVEFESARQHIDNEIDRLNQLMMGIAAFTTASDNPPRSVALYLDLTGADDRFAGLVESRTIDPGGPIDARPQLDAEVLEAMGANPARTPILTTHVLGGENVTALSFALGARHTEWATLIFLSDSFLARAMTPTTVLRTELVNTGNTVGSQIVTYTVGDTIPIQLAGGGRLTANLSVDVFGTEFMVTSTASPDLLRRVGYSSVLILLIAGGTAAIGLYSALQSLSRSRASALESVRTKDRELGAVDRRFKASFERVPIGMAEVDGAGCVVAINAAMCAQTGRKATDLVGVALSTFVNDGDQDAHAARMAALLDGTTDANQGEHRYRHADGHDVWVHESISVISSDADGAPSLLVQSQDITSQRRAAWELAQRALHDDLTGLPNRTLFLNRLKRALVKAGRNHKRVAVMFIDIDHFKVINDSLGHQVGDQLLVEIAERLSRATRHGDTVARFGGDEFVALVDCVSGESEASAAAQRIHSVFAEPFRLGPTPTYATASIGITLSSDDGESADELLRDADAAMYRAKDGGRNRAEVFDHSMRTNILARMEIESQLRGALSNGEIVMHYQAIVDPATHLPAGYEALIRWNHPKKGLLGPAAFLGAAEEAGLIHLIDSFALRTTCQQIAEWAEKFPAFRNLYLTTNWSARHLGRFVQQVEQVLSETKINPNQLVIEVTERFLIEDSDASVLALNQLKQLGVQIAIDDFGTGYNSLSYLTQFAVDYLKIDRSFVSQLPESEASAAVIGAIADLATRLGIKLVAEGVETDEQIEMLASLGSPRLQGYRFAKPRPARDIEYHLAARAGLVEGSVREAENALAEPATPQQTPALSLG
jgi:diguanylate cyclase (GGDEF)-like protein/PAS domain S-box-containing protein